MRYSSRRFLPATGVVIALIGYYVVMNASAQFSWQWFLGIALIVIGTLLIARPERKKGEKELKSKGVKSSDI